VTGDWLPYIPLALSLASVAIWVLAFAGIADFWRSHRTAPAGVRAALLLVVGGAVVARLMSAPRTYAPDLGWLATLGGHIERGLLVTAGLWALVLLARSRHRWSRPAPAVPADVSPGAGT
jgi:hypothetical protein